MHLLTDNTPPLQPGHQQDGQSVGVFSALTKLLAMCLFLPRAGLVNKSPPAFQLATFETLSLSLFSLC